MNTIAKFGGLLSDPASLRSLFGCFARMPSSNDLTVVENFGLVPIAISAPDGLRGKSLRAQVSVWSFVGVKLAEILLPLTRLAFLSQ